MARQQVSIHLARDQVRNEMGRPIKVHGFEHREIGPHIFNALYYSVEYPETGVLYRAAWWADGKKAGGMAF